MYCPHCTCGGFRSVGYVYKFRRASNPWVWFPYLKEKMPRALDLVVRPGPDATGGSYRAAGFKRC